MLGAPSISPAMSGPGAFTDQSICFSPYSSSRCYSSTEHVSIRFMNYWWRHCIRNSRVRLNSFMVTSCKSSFGRFSDESEDHVGEDDNYVEATVLMSETISHFQMLKRGLQEGTRWQPSLLLGPFSAQANDPRTQVNSLGAGTYAVEKLIDSFDEDERGDCPNQFQLTRNLMEQLGYEVKMVKITKRVVNTYFARILLHKPGEMKPFCVDARPSDAINIAKRCKAPIYVNKQVVLADATMVHYGMFPARKKSTYDVTLDSAADGPDLLSEELNLVKNMNLAAEEERYDDAAMWRDKLMKLRESK